MPSVSHCPGRRFQSVTLNPRLAFGRFIPRPLHRQNQEILQRMADSVGTLLPNPNLTPTFLDNKLLQTTAGEIFQLHNKVQMIIIRDGAASPVTYNVRVRDI